MRRVKTLKSPIFLFSKKKMSWWGKTLKRFGRETKEPKNLPDVKQLRKMVNDRKKYESTDDIVEFFCDKFMDYSLEELQKMQIENEITLLIDYFAPLFIARISDFSDFRQGIMFLEKSVPLYKVELSESKKIFTIIIEMLKTILPLCIDSAAPLMRAVFSHDDILPLFFTGENLKLIFQHVFVSRQEISDSFGRILIDSALQYTPPDYQSLEPLLNYALSLFGGEKISKDMKPNAIEFIGSIVYKIDTKDFVPKFFSIIIHSLKELDSFLPLKMFLVAKSNDPSVVWNAMNHQESDEKINLNALKAVHLIKEYEQAKQFDLIPYVKKTTMIPAEYQKYLFELAEYNDLDQKVEIFKESWPPWYNKIQTEYFSQFVLNTDWSEKYDTIIQITFGKVDINEIYKEIVEDNYISKIISEFYEHVPSNWNKTADCMKHALDASITDSDRSIKTIQALMSRVDPKLYIDILIDYCSMDVVNALVFNVMTVISQKRSDFVGCFTENNGFNSLTKHISLPIVLDFIASIAADGPVKEIDEWIAKTDFSGIDSILIETLMCGLPHDSCDSGLLRIPSLCKYVRPKLETAFDRYIYGKYAELYIEPNEDDLLTSAKTYMTKKTAEKFLASPESLATLLADLINTFNVYQFHPKSRECTATIKSSGSTFFWISVQKVFRKTQLFNVGGNAISIVGDNITFGDSSRFCKANTWHLISFNFKVLERNLQVTFDGESIGQISTTNKEITIGGAQQSAIWYISELFKDQSQFSDDLLQKVFLEGPRNMKQKLSIPVLFVPYNGVITNYVAFGGSDLFWSTCFNSTEVSHVLSMTIAAFAMERSGVITRDDLFNGLNAVLIQMPSFLTQETGQLLIMESMKDEASLSQLLVYLLNDLFYLASPTIEHRLIPSIVSEIPDQTAIFDAIAFTLIFFKVKPESLSNLSEALRSIVSRNKQLAQKLMVYARGLPFLESDKIETPEDERIDDIQSLFVDICIKEGNFPQTSEDFVEAFLTISKKQALKLLTVYVDKSIENEQFFDPRVIRQIYAGLAAFVAEQETWVSIFSLLVNKKLTSVKDVLNEEIVRTQLLSTCFDLANELLRVSLKSELCSSVIDIISSLIENSKDPQAVDAVAAVINFCSVGFFGFEPSVIPHTIIPDDSIHVRETHSPKKIDFTNPSQFPMIDDLQVVESPSTCFRELKASDLDTNLPVVQKIVELAVKTLNRILSYPINDFKRALCNITIQSADVLCSVAESMHTLIISKFLDGKPEFIGETKAAFFDFLIGRIAEGWWTGNDLVNIVQKAISLGISKKVSLFTAVLITAEDESCLDPLIQDTNEFSQASNHEQFMALLIEKLSTFKLSEEMKTKLINALPSTCKLVDALKEGTIENLLTDACKRLAQEQRELVLVQTRKDEQAIHQLRFKNTRKPETNVFEYRRNVNSYLARESLKRLFAAKYNKLCVAAEECIASIFRLRMIHKFWINPAEKFYIAQSSNPLFVPQKPLPLVYNFCSPHTRQTQPLRFPTSSHKSSLQYRIESMAEEQKAAKVLENIELPLFIFDPKIAAKIFKERYNATLPLFQCNLFVTSELLPCVGLYSKTGFTILLNANLKDSDTLIINPTSEILAHFGILESSVCGLLGQSSLFFHNTTLTYNYDMITAIDVRQYAYLPKAVDMYTCDGRHLTIVMEEQDRKIFISKLKPSIKDDAFYLLQLSPNDAAKLWSKGEISTFDYLLTINHAGGRSFNDYSQYPVVPWVIGDYKSEETPTKLRDLSKPMGMQSSERAERFKQTFQETEDHYLYGTHYSHPAAVFHFMLRLEPYTLFFYHLHNGWDHRDRIFCDINESWKSAAEANQTDLKELIPEFYSFPDFLLNVNNIPILEKSDGKVISNVYLPPWSKTPIDFIWKMRCALEEADISQWIDLIFGYKQRGAEAIKANNVFHPLTYDKNGTPNVAKVLDEKGKIDAINNFGQCPRQVFTSPHPSLDRYVQQNLVSEPDLRVTELVSCDPSQKTIVVTDHDHIEFLQDKHVFFGGKDVSITDSMIQAAGITDVSAYATSGNSSILALASPSGIIHVLFSRSSTVNKMYCPGSALVTLFVSSHFMSIIASTKQHLMMFDITTGFLSRTISIPDIKYIAYDRVSNIIVTATQTKIIVLYSDFNVLAEKETEKITSLSVSDSCIFVDQPFFVTGTEAGNVIIWCIDVVSRKVKIVRSFDISRNSITSVAINANGASIIVLDSEGRVFSLTCPHIKHKFAQAELFKGCVCCGEEANGMSSGFCSVCGRHVCNKCLLKGKCVDCRKDNKSSGEASNSPVKEESPISLVPEDTQDDPFMLPESADACLPTSEDNGAANEQSAQKGEEKNGSNE